MSLSGLFQRMAQNFRQGLAAAVNSAPYRQAAALIDGFLHEVGLAEPAELERAIDAGRLRMDDIARRIPPEVALAAQGILGPRLRSATKEDYLAVLRFLHELNPGAADVLVRRWSWYCRQMDQLRSRLLGEG